MTRSGNSRLNLMASIVVWIGIIAGSIYFSNRRSAEDVGTPKIKTRDDFLRERAEADAERPQQTLIEAIEANLVVATIQGDGPTSAILTLTKPGNVALNLVVEAGSILRPNDYRLSEMIVNQQVEISLFAGEHKTTRDLDVRSLEMQSASAGPDNVFSIEVPQTVRSEVLKLAGSPWYQRADPRLQQFAIWIVTDNPTPRGFVGSGVTAVAPAPDAAELSLIERLFRDVGLPPGEYRAFAESGPATAEKTAVPKVRMKLAEAMKRGKVKVSVKGDGLEHVSLTIELADEETEASLEIEIEAGTVFASSKSTIQNMMANKNVVAELTSLRPKLSLSISVSCMNMHRKEPGESDSLTIAKQDSEDLIKLAANKNFQLAGERGRQFAVWTVTDNPKRNGYVGIGNFGFGSGPDEKELSAIRTLLKESGIDPQKYQAFGGPDPLVAASRAKRKMEQEKETAEQQRRYRLIAVTTTDSGTPIYGVMFASPTAANLTEKDLEDIGRSVKQAPRAIVWFYLPGMNAATQKPWATATFKSSRTITEIYPDRRPK